MKNKIIIDIKPEDVTKGKLNFSSSGQVIDELAYCAKQWESNDLWENNIEYEPIEPYNFNYEDDLLQNTKTSDQLYKLAQDLKISLNANWERIAKEQGIQAGACVALNNPEEWSKLLDQYTEELKNNQSDTISKEFTAQLEKEKESFQKDQYNEWLNGSRDYAGVIQEIAKYFTEDRESGLYDNEKDVYSFIYDEEEAKSMLNEYTGYTEKFSIKRCKEMLLDQIISSGNNITNKKRTEADKRKIEREATKKYKAERAEGERKARENKLKALKI